MNLKLSLAVVVALLTIAITQRTADAKPIRIAIPGYNMTQIAFCIARERGFFKEEGLDVELVMMTGTVANLALMSGEVPFTSVPTAAMSANLRGANLAAANLTNAALARAYLRQANLNSANLSGADLSRADLTDANLTGAALDGAIA